MKVFLDTNVILENLCDRSLADEAQTLLRKVDEGLIDAFINSGSFSNITYIADKQMKLQGIERPQRTMRLRMILEGLLETLEIVPQGNKDLLEGVCNKDFDDVEDSYQYQAFLKSDCNYLVTINVHDFPCHKDNRIVHLTEFVNDVLPNIIAE